MCVYIDVTTYVFIWCVIMCVKHRYSICQINFFSSSKTMNIQTSFSIYVKRHHEGVDLHCHCVYVCECNM